MQDSVTGILAAHRYLERENHDWRGLVNEVKLIIILMKAQLSFEWVFSHGLQRQQKQKSHSPLVYDQFK